VQLPKLVEAAASNTIYYTHLLGHYASMLFNNITTAKETRIFEILSMKNEVKLSAIEGIHDILTICTPRFFTVCLRFIFEIEIISL